MSIATPKRKSIYDFTDDYEKVIELLENAEEVGDEELVQMLNDTIEAIAGSIEQKFEALVKVRKNFEGEFEMLKAEKMRLEKKQAAAKKSADRITSIIEQNLTRLGFNAKNKKKVSAGLFKVGFRKSPATIRIFDVNRVPKEYVTIPDPVVDKKALLTHAKTLLKDEHKDRDEIQLDSIGVVVENGKQTLSIT